MSGAARHVIKGAAAWLIVNQAIRIAQSSGKTIYKIRDDELQLAVFDSKSETAVIFDAASLAALASIEELHDRPVERTGGIDVRA